MEAYHLEFNLAIFAASPPNTIIPTRALGLPSNYYIAGRQALSLQGADHTFSSDLKG